MSDPTEPADGGLCRDWDLLQRIDQDLRDLAQRYGLPLEDVPDVLSGGEQTKATQRRTEQVNKILQDKRGRGERDPISWQELALGMNFGGGWLAWFVKSRKLCRALPDDRERQDVLTDVVAKLYFVILRNVGKWHRLGNHDQD